MGWWSDIFTQRAEDWLYHEFQSAQVPGQVPSVTLQSGESYLSITLKSMRVVDVRKGLSKFYGAVHSFISVPHRSGKVAQFHVLTTPANLKNVDASRIDRVIQMNQPLLGPIPYRGGSLELELGLFSIKAADLAAPFLSVLEGLSKAAGVSYVSAALPFVGPIKDGINLLTGGSDDSILEIGIAKNFQPVKTGYFCVMRAPKAHTNATGWKVDAHDFRLIDENGSPIGEYPYMVWQIDASPKREDWFLIPELAEPYKVLQEDVKKGKIDLVKESLIVFKRAVLTCNDLVTADATKLAAKIETETQDILQATRTATSKQKMLPELQEIELYK